VERIKELTERANAGEELTEAEWRQILRKAENTHSYVYWKYMKAARKERKPIRALMEWGRHGNYPAFLAGVVIERIVSIVIAVFF
jgi:hypothetical protein